MWRDICWKETLYWEEEPAAELELTVPLPAEHGRGADRMGRWCARLAAIWYRRWTGEFYRAACGACAGAREASRPFWPWRARLSAAVTRADDRVCSLWMEGSERRGREEGRQVRAAATWTRRDGLPLTLGELFPGERHWKGRALDRVEEGLRAMRAEGVCLRRDAEGRARTRFSPRRFYLTSEGPVLYYPMGALGPAGTGILTFPLTEPGEGWQIPEKV